MNTTIKTCVKLFDVTLRDGLQTNKRVFSFKEKKNILDSIMKKYNPPDIEVGSIVSEKILPQMRHSVELYHYGREKYPNSNFYLLVPNYKYLEKGMYMGIRNYSFITSVSESFQLKNTKMSISKTKEELMKMTNILTESKSNGLKKLYISCINECPIDGKINIKHIVNEILHYSNSYNFDNICISDTCGSLTFKNLTNIIEKCVVNGLDPKILTIHLHIGENDKTKLKLFVDYLEKNGIITYDVSTLEDSGGCSVTIDEGMTRRNLTYHDLNVVEFN